MSLFLIVALPFLGALLPGLMIEAGRRACGLTAFFISLTAFVGLMQLGFGGAGHEIISANLANSEGQVRLSKHKLCPTTA